MLLLADRAYWGHALWGACSAASADLLWRVKSDIRLPVRQPLPDGARLSVVNGTREAHRRNMRNASRRSRSSRLPQEEGPLPGDVTVRVIEFLITLTCEDGTTRGWEFNDDNVSALRGAYRPGYEEVLRLVREGQVGDVVRWQTSRLLRNRRERAEAIGVFGRRS